LFLVKSFVMSALMLSFNILLTACGGQAQAQLPTATFTPMATDTPTLTIIEETPSSVKPSSTPAPTETSHPATPTATFTARPPTATPSPAPLHPLSIAWLRQQRYPGSEITIEETLESGVNYDRYIASYLSEGLKIYALLTVPQGQPPATGWPAIIFNHGYIPPAQYRTTERYVAYVDGFARNGYIVFRPDYRGHGNSEGEAPGGYGSSAYTIDVLNAVTSIKNYPAADSGRIGMWGHSMGGNITLRSMVTSNDIKAGVMWAGVVGSYPDLLENWRLPNHRHPEDAPNSPRRWRETLAEEFGSPQDNPDFWAAISANSFVDEISGPVQLHHSPADTHVPAEFSETLEAQLQTAGKIVEYYVYENDDHDLTNNFSLAMERSVAFFDRYVKGE
jgi:dienelactone hydrolase